MNHRGGRSPWLPSLGASLVVLAILSCVAQLTENGREKPLAPPGPTLNHATHLALNIVCADCHDVEEAGTPELPSPENCFDCHDENLDEGPAPVREYFEAIRQPDGRFEFPKLLYSTDLITSHKAHADRGVACADCHGEPSEGAFTRPPLEGQKAACMGCHEERGASTACATCHRETRRDRAPASHADNFFLVHGRQAPEGWQEGEGGLCALCHAVPKSCNSCHEQYTPASHRSPAFRLDHGRGASDAQDERFENTSCALCHEEGACVSCHQREMPRNHSVPFTRRLHGIVASLERQSCLTCHKQDYCDRCHQETKPLSHRGSFGSGRQTHCLACHDPLPQNGCYACHKNTLGHLQATPLPPGLPHSAATDCMTCHTLLPHLDDGGSCRRCHR